MFIRGVYMLFNERRYVYEEELVCDYTEIYICYSNHWYNRVAIQKFI